MKKIFQILMEPYITTCPLYVGGICEIQQLKLHVCSLVGHFCMRSNIWAVYKHTETTIFAHKYNKWDLSFLRDGAPKAKTVLAPAFVTLFMVMVIQQNNYFDTPARQINACYIFRVDTPMSKQPCYNLYRRL